MTTEDSKPEYEEEDEKEAQEMQLTDEPRDDKATFADLGLSEEVLRALESIGYESPSSIQEQTIPHIMAGRDLVGQAQTGTGKTGAFALPLLSRLNMSNREPQVLVLVPTRELAIQVSEAFTRYAKHLFGFHVIPIYGGQGIEGQLKQLRRGVHVIVATPGRLTDHMKRGTIKLDTLKCFVIDEADEMLRMGFIDDVEWILQRSPPERQITLFSATMPGPIRKIAGSYLQSPITVTIEAKTATAATIRQRYWMVSGMHKLDALTRILEAEEFDGILIFVKTRNATTELASRLEARGFAVAPLSGDISQHQREATVDKLKRGDIDILVATDVAARGLDVSRISHVINYDIPYDTEAYIHRIGRTGRAGRSGEAILFVSPRERRMLLAIEKATRQKIELMRMPSPESINDIRIAKFKQRITDTLAAEELGFYYQMIEEFRQQSNVPAIEIAAALARLLQGDTPMLLDKAREKSAASGAYAPQEDFDDRPRRKDSRREKEPYDREKTENRRRNDEVEPGFERYRLDVGFAHGVKPGSIVGAIANEGGLDGENIGRINIRDDFATVDLPEGMPREVFDDLQKTVVAGRPIKIAKWTPEMASQEASAPKRPFKKPGDKPFGGKPRSDFKSPRGSFSKDDKPRRSFKSDGPPSREGAPKREGFKFGPKKEGGFKGGFKKKDGPPSKSGPKKFGPKKDGGFKGKKSW